MERSQTIPYEVSYLGIPVIDMVLTWQENDSTTTITYNNRLKPLLAYFQDIHDVYNVTFSNGSFSPITWSKQVKEGSFRFSISARRDLQYHRADYDNGKSFPFPEKAFTIFSATHFLASKIHDPTFFPTAILVFIDGEIWQADVRRYSESAWLSDAERQDQTILLEAVLHHVRGKSFLKRNDILTQHIAQENSRFLLWVTQDETINRARFGEFPKAVVLNRVKN